MLVRNNREVPDLSDLREDPTRWAEQLSEVVEVYHLELWLVRRDGEWKVKQAKIHGLRGIEGL